MARVLGALWSVVLSGMLFCFAQADVHYLDFVIVNSNYTRLCSSKTMMTVNGSFPGPAIYARKGDTLYVNVFNEGDYGLTLHWHGVKQPRNPWFDGPEYITQCPIPPGTNLTYQIILSSEEGTVWWHAHSDWTRATIHGAIVVYPAEGTTYPFPEPDGQQILVFESWYKDDVMTLMDYALKNGGLTKLSDAFAINGQPGDFYPCSNETTFHMQVEYGKTYLLRLLNAAMNQDFFFAIADHNFTVVGWDGSYIKPITVAFLLITPGQTMDVLVTANQPLGKYYIIAKPYFDGQADDFDKSITSAVFEYRGNLNESIPSYPVGIPDWYDVSASAHYWNLTRSLASPEHPIDVPLDIDTRMYIALSINLMKCPNDSCAGPAGDRLAAGLNNITFANPDVDILQAYYWNMSGYFDPDFPNKPPTLFNFTSDDLLDDNVTLSEQGTKVKLLNYNETVEITFQGTNVMNSGENHPIHIHGFRFYVVGLGMGVFDNVTDPLNYNLNDPPEANTVAVPKDGWATIRFRADNPGVWFMHCHYDRHMSWGMDSAFIVKSGGTPETSVLSPPAYLPSCSSDQSLLGHMKSVLLTESK